MPLDECPECHADLKGASSEEIRAHRVDHWPDEIPYPHINKEAVARAKALEDASVEKQTAERRDAARDTLKEGR